MTKSERYYGTADPDSENGKILFFVHEDGDDCVKHSKVMRLKRYCKPVVSENGLYHAIKIESKKGIGYAINHSSPDFYAQDVRSISFTSDNERFSKKKELPHIAQYLALVDNVWELKTVRM